MELETTRSPVTAPTPELVAIPEPFRPYLAAVLLRFGYLFPDCRAEIEGEHVTVSAADALATREGARQLRYLLYREKILDDAGPIRRAVYRRLFGS